MKPVNIGRMGQRIEFCRMEETEDAMGQTIVSPVPFLKVWADISEKNGAERSVADKLRAENYFKITVRYIEGITTDMLVLWKGRLLEIKSAINLYERDRILELECTEYPEKEDSDGRDDSDGA